jgi:hypothetical protein
MYIAKRNILHNLMLPEGKSHDVNNCNHEE